VNNRSSGKITAAAMNPSKTYQPASAPMPPVPMGMTSTFNQRDRPSLRYTEKKDSETFSKIGTEKPEENSQSAQLESRKLNEVAS